jgi:hypothetical protein
MCVFVINLGSKQLMQGILPHNIFVLVRCMCIYLDHDFVLSPFQNIC